MKLFHSFGQRSINPLTFDEFVNFFSFNGISYPNIVNQTLGSPTEEIGGDFRGLIEGAHRSNGIVFACMMVRQLLFQEARFQFRQLASGRPGDYFGSAALLPLERPWQNATTGDLLARAIQDVDLGGNFFAVRLGNEIRRLRPDWVTVVMGSRALPDDPAVAPDVEVIGYAYEPRGRGAGQMITYLPEQVVHFAPYPDPLANFRGMSWLTPVVREIMGDQAATTHKLKFFEQGATGNMVVKFDPAVDQESVEKWIEMFEGNVGGAANAYRTLFLGGGADAQVVGTDLRQVDFKKVQGAGETRIAAAAGVPPIIVGLSEGLEAATYSNYELAMRRFADITMRPLWRNIAGSLATLIRVPRNAQLWYDDRDIPALADDIEKAANTQNVNAQAVKALTEAGFDPDTVVEAITAGDLTRLEHTGQFSVQLQPAGTPTPPERVMLVNPDQLPERAEKPAGEAELRQIADRFAEVDRRVRSLLAEAVNGDREARLGEALEEMDALRSERVDEAVFAAYAAAFDAAALAIEEKAESPASAAPLAESLRAKLDEGITTAQDNASEAFRTVNEDNLDVKGQDAVTAHVDEAERRLSLGGYSGMLIGTLGGRATSRGIKDAVGGGMVQFSSHDTTHPACTPLEGQTFPAASAPEPPIHEGCAHTLIPLSG